jgi:cardiolipin synthase
MRINLPNPRASRQNRCLGAGDIPLERHVETLSLPKSGHTTMRWLCEGREIFPAMLEAIAESKKTVRLETYTYTDGKIGRQFLAALTAAAHRGVDVQVLVDAIGSWLLPSDFFHPLIAAGAEVRFFNPIHPLRFSVRDHRKLLVCDDFVSFIGGFNVADEYDGDGVTCGWCDLGLQIRGHVLGTRLAHSFGELFALSRFQQKSWLQFRAFRRRRKIRKGPTRELLLAQPGRGASPFQIALYRDLRRAKHVRIVSPYFLPTHRLRRELMRVARQGGRVQLILAGKSDVLVSQLAARSLYRRLLKAGVEIYEYQPQILHTKLVCIDDVVYVGSSNFDIRSLNLNYELMLRLDHQPVTSQAGEIFTRLLGQSRIIQLEQWQKSQTFWQRWKNRWAHFLLTRIDPLVALQQFRTLTKNAHAQK